MTSRSRQAAYSKLLAQSIRSHLTMPVLFSGDSSGDHPITTTLEGDLEITMLYFSGGIK